MMSRDPSFNAIRDANKHQPTIMELGHHTGSFVGDVICAL